jgi:hypothetical protein
MKSPVFEILRRSLDSGQTIEVEGLGTFQRSVGRRYRFVPQTQPRIFIAYAVEDLAAVRRLAKALRSAGCSPWLDKDKLLPGQNWPRAIQRAIETSDACVVCFSPRSVSKRGQFQSELRYAIDCARSLPLDQVFLVPVRLETCTVPICIAQQVQYVDLFPNWARGVQRIVRVIRRTAPLRSSVVLSSD